MPLAALASPIWHSAISALGTPRAEIAGFSPAAPKPKAAAHAGSAPPEQKILDDLQSWVQARQQQEPSASAQQARAAYAATSALGRAGS